MLIWSPSGGLNFVYLGLKLMKKILLYYSGLIFLIIIQFLSIINAWNNPVCLYLKTSSKHRPCTIILKLTNKAMDSQFTTLSNPIQLQKFWTIHVFKLPLSAMSIRNYPIFHELTTHWKISPVRSPVKRLPGSRRESHARWYRGPRVTFKYRETVTVGRKRLAGIEGRMCKSRFLSDDRYSRWHLELIQTIQSNYGAKKSQPRISHQGDAPLFLLDHPQSNREDSGGRITTTKWRIGRRDLGSYFSGVRR